MKRQKKSFKEFIRGEIFDETTSGLSFRISNCWYHVKEDYLMEVEILMRRMLSSCLIKEGDPGYINKNYMNSETEKPFKEGEYNLLFENEDSFIVGDKALVSKIELFDLLHISDCGKIFMYHVKAGIGQSTRDAVSQIINSAQLIQSICLSQNPSDQQKDEFKKFYEKLKKENKDKPKSPKCHEILLTESKFKEALRDAYVVYAIVDTHNKDKSRSLQKESDKTTQMDFKLIASILQGKKEELNEEEIAKAVEKCFKELKWVDKDNKVTSKLLHLTKTEYNDVVKFDNDYLNKKKNKDGLFEILKQEYLSSYNTLIFKHEILRVQVALANLGFNRFGICEIPYG